LLNCVFDENHSDQNGGAISVEPIYANFDNPAGATVEGSLISRNTADVDGGGIYHTGESSVTLVNCTLASNEAGGNGGGVSAAVLEITNSVLWGNIAGFFGLQIFNNQNPAVPFPNVSNSLIQDDYDGSNIIIGNPRFLSDVPAGYDGVFGTEDDGYQLESGSPAINLGDNAAVTLSEDLLENPRVSEVTVDLGPYEGGKAPPDLDDDGLLDAWEFEHFGNFDEDATDDPDEDDLDNLAEFEAGTDPTLEDSDFDGLLDGEEINTNNTDPTNPDSDEDTIPDGYEVTNGLDPNEDDAGADSDGDGVSNRLEFLYGTRADDSDAFPIFMAEVHSAIELEWPSVDGAFYQIQESMELETWQDLGDPIPGDGSKQGVFISIKGESKKFYRVIAVH